MLRKLFKGIALASVALVFMGASGGPSIPLPLSNANGGNETGATQINPQSVVRQYNGTSASFYPQNSYCFNCDPIYFPHWRAAMGKVRSGTGNARLLVVGDSTSFGNYSNNSVSGDWVTGSWPHLLAGAFSGKSINANATSFFGFLLYANDPRITYAGGWTGDSTTSVGGYVSKGTATGNTLQFTPTVPNDSYKIWHLTHSGGGTVTYNIDGGSTLLTSSYNGADSLTFDTINSALGIHTPNVVWSSGGSTWVDGVEAWDSTISQVIIMNAGWSNSKTSDWQGGTGFGPTAGITSVGADLTIISLMINNWCSGGTVSQFISDTQNLITAAKVNGDVLLLTEFPSQPGTLGCATQSQQQGFVAAAYSLAQSNSIGLVDEFNRVQSYVISSVAPYSLYFSGNTIHPGPPGYADTEQSVFNAIGGM